MKLFNRSDAYCRVSTKSSHRSSKRALIVGRSDELIADLPHLLATLDFSIDIIVPKYSALRWSRYVDRNYFFIDKESLLEHASYCVETHIYDWVIVGDDPTLGDILNAPIDENIKQKLLPVISKDYFAHLYSKIQLSNYLQKNAISTPNYAVVGSVQEALESARRLTYPVVLKVDQSGGGWGVHFCKEDRDIERLNALFTGKKLLIQSYVQGQEVAISALYLNARLIHFDYSTVEKRTKNYGISILRRYRHEMMKDEKLKNELEQLGQALGIHGFVNMSCLSDLQTGSRSYIEADIRPTAWSVYAKYASHSLVDGIRAYFATQASPSSVSRIQQPVQDLMIPHYLRIRFWELLFNRYHVWRYMLWDDFGLMLALVIKRYFVLPMGKRLIKFFPRSIRKSAQLSFHQKIML